MAIKILIYRTAYVVGHIYNYLLFCFHYYSIFFFLKQVPQPVMVLYLEEMIQILRDLDHW
jgi:hypothetical protein